MEAFLLPGNPNHIKIARQKQSGPLSEKIFIFKIKAKKERLWPSSVWFLRNFSFLNFLKETIGKTHAFGIYI